MSWLQVELSATPATLADTESALTAAGALAITLVSDAQEPVLEPAPGETPLWSSVRVQGLFSLDTDIAALRQRLADLAADVNIDVRFINSDTDQVSHTNHAVNQVFAGRLWLLPKDATAEASGDLVQLRLEPGLAFGSGSHPTTRLCLEWLAEHVQPGQRVLDFGCGSGVLGIAAALLGATVTAVDHDDQAVMASRDNAAYNGLSSSQFQVMPLTAWRAQEYVRYFDVVVANILAAPLKSLAAQFEQVLAASGALVLSGVLEEQAVEVMDSYLEISFAPARSQEGWVCLTGART